MTLCELATAVIHKLPLKILVLNNHYLGMVRQWQELFWDERYSGVENGPSPDWVKLAEAFGAKGLRCEDSGDLEEMTKVELYKLATAAEVAGRSSMTKAQLVAALSSS